MTRTGTTIFLIAVAISAGCLSPETRRQRSLSTADDAAANGDLERAAEILRRAQAYDPRDPLIATPLAHVYEELGNFHQASRLVEDFPREIEEPSWLNLRARLLFRRGRYVNGARIASALEQRGEAEVETVEAFLEVVVERRLAPENSGALPERWHSMLVERLLEEEKPVTALSWIELLPKNDPLRERHLEPFVELALESDDPEIVRRVWRLVEPGDSGSETLVHRRLLALNGRSAEVERLDAHFLGRYPDHPKRGEVLVAEARRRLSRSESEEALRLLDEALSLDGNDVPALVLKGLVLQWSGRTEEAEIVLRTALAFDSRNQMAREALESMQDEPEAVIMRIETLPP